MKSKLNAHFCSTSTVFRSKDFPNFLGGKIHETEH